jgi:hypothetical protein
MNEAEDSSLAGSMGRPQVRTPIWRFSLSNLFLIMTLIATLIGMSFNYPLVTAIALIFTSPLLFCAAMAFLANRKSAWATLARTLVLAAAVCVVSFLLLLLVW